MIRNLKIFLLLSLFSLKTILQHRLGVISFLFGKTLRFLMYFLFLYFLVSKTKLLAGYTLSQTIVFFLTFNFIDSTAQLLFREVYRFRPLIVSGEFDHVLIKPYNPFLRVLIGGIDFIDVIMIFPFLLILIFFIGQSGHYGLINEILYIGLIVNSLLIACSFHIVVLSLAILTTEVDHALMIYRDLTKMVSLPVDIYREPLRSILLFVIPVGIMMTVPVKALFGLLSVNVFIICFIIAISFLLLSLFLWKVALRKYQSWGG